MKDGAEDPAGDSDVCEHHVERTQAIRRRDTSTHFGQTVPVSVEIPEGEEHRKRLLHPEEAVEWPFAVELDNGLVGGDSLGGYNVLAGIVAFGGAVPEKETAERSYHELLGRVLYGGAQKFELVYVVRETVRMGVCAFPGAQFSVLQTCRAVRYVINDGLSRDVPRDIL